ncbi:MAG: nucleotidyltransferase domain-containing protein [Candidatus Woesearchaeota archaeon]
MSVYRLLQRVASRLRPEPEVLDVVEVVRAQLQEAVVLFELDAEVVLGGSVAKGTFLRDAHDVDVFVRFSLSYASEDLSELLAPVMKRFGAQRVHGSRDYFSFEKNSLVFEVVPVLAVTSASQARNVTDVSPLHVRFVQESGVSVDEIRLLKQFCKAIGVYGAESYLRGFSGHVIDLLVIYYGSFLEVVSAACSWSAPVVIDVQQHHQDPLVVLNESKLGPLVVVDPIQPFRNAAAALGEEVFTRFVHSCQEFFSSPSEEFFVVQSFNQEALFARVQEASASLLIEVNVDASKRDVAGSRVRKFFERVRDELVSAGFSFREADWFFAHQSSSFVWFILEKGVLSPRVLRQGPPVVDDQHCARFRKQHAEVFEKDGLLWAYVDRDVSSLSAFRLQLEVLASQSAVALVAVLLQEEGLLRDS